MTPEEENYLNSLAMYHQVASVLHLRKIALVKAYLARCYPQYRFEVGAFPHTGRTLDDHAQIEISVSSRSVSPETLAIVRASVTAYLNGLLGYSDPLLLVAHRITDQLRQ